MRLILRIGLGLAMTFPATAHACDGLGLSNAYLTEHFCNALKDISKSDQLTRGGVALPGAGPEDGLTTGPALPDWPNVTVLQDAYRADPRKTLELIRRIKDAGGLGSN